MEELWRKIWKLKKEAEERLMPPIGAADWYAEDVVECLLLALTSLDRYREIARIEGVLKEMRGLSVHVTDGGDTLATGRLMMDEGVEGRWSVGGYLFFSESVVVIEVNENRIVLDANHTTKAAVLHTEQLEELEGEVVVLDWFGVSVGALKRRDHTWWDVGSNSFEVGRVENIKGNVISLVE